MRAELGFRPRSVWLSRLLPSREKEGEARQGGSETLEPSFPAAMGILWVVGKAS